MEHREALESNAAERYFLEELSLADREAFEEHYFGCAECAREVAEIAAFLAGGRSAVQDRERAPDGSPAERDPRFLRRSYALALGLAAGLVFAAGLVAYQRLRPAPPDSGSHVFPELALECTPGGGGGVIAVPPNSRSFGLAICTGPARGVGHYELDLRREDGKPVFLLTSAPPAGSGRIHVLIPAGPVARGWYRLTVRGLGVAGSVEERATHRFRIERR